MKCVLSDSDRRTTGQYVQLVDAQGVDYFENLCLKNNQACKNNRVLQSPRFGVSEDKVAQYVGLHYYTDKELQVTSEAACKLACEIENEFLCRSFLYLGQPNGQQYNCRLYHMDHKVCCRRLAVNVLTVNLFIALKKLNCYSTFSFIALLLLPTICAPLDASRRSLDIPQHRATTD